MRHDNDSFEKKLASYVALATSILASAPKADAQIIYTDVNPDAIIQGNYSGVPYQLDLNNDGIVDFKLRNQFSTDTSYVSNAFSSTLLSSNKILGYGNNLILKSSSLNLPKPLQIGDTIGVISDFIDNGLIRYKYHTFQGNSSYSISTNIYGGLFPAGVEKFIGFKLSMGGNIYYGWARIKTDEWGVLTIYDYAVNSTPNQQILAGQQ